MKEIRHQIKFKGCGKIYIAKTERNLVTGTTKLFKERR
jgi:hypothetical protein